MTDEISHLALQVVVPDPWKVETLVEVRPLVDGVDIVAEGFPKEPAESPYGLLRPESPLEATAESHEVRLAEAACVEECCGALYVTIRRDGEHIVWYGWRDPGSVDIGLPEFRFDAKQYQAEIDRVCADRSWEWTACTVARLLEQDLGRRVEWFERWDCRLLSARSYPWQRDRINLFFGRPRRMPAGGSWSQFMVTLLVSDADPSVQAGEIAERLLATDPREFVKSEERASQRGDRSAFS
ncbi:hypothetical protein [Saccharopolyspora shandongensis]|uniref:hypothetical protein n=1 Tax=Saccharopolyspora shandongensis TaxID=418495 RepID=UPI0033E3FC28